MSDTSITVTPPATTTTEPDTGLEAEVAKWKAMARKHEDQAKLNADAAAQLAKIEESQKSEADKAADRLTKAEQRATQAEAKALRREIALEHKLTTDDAGLLDNVTDEAAMRALAARLAGAESARTKNGNHVPLEGTSTTASTSEERALARSLFGGDPT